jgi:hypothetical protein
MSRNRLFTLLITVLVCLAAGRVFARSGAEQPSPLRQPLVPCVADKNQPCVQNVEKIGDIVGVWRSYLRDSSGVQFGFTIYKDDGSVAVTSDLQKEPTVIGSITFANGIATITANSNTLTTANCVGPGSYQMRVLRMGNQSVALAYHSNEPMAKDICFGRVGGFIQPLLYYPGTGKDLTDLDANRDALAQPLVPCMALPRPCDVIATKMDDVKGFWKVYLDPVPQGFGVWHTSEAGAHMLVGSGDDLTTYKEFFPPGAFPNSFNGVLLLGGDPTSTDPCSSGVAILRVLKFGNQPIALQWTAVQDGCPPRIADFSEAMIWIKGQ